MSFTLPKETDQQIVEEAISYNLDGSQVSYILLIDGEDFSDKITSAQGEWGTDDSGVNYFDCRLGTVLPRRLEGAPVQFALVIDGVSIPQLTGIDSLSEMGDDRASTDPFHSASAGRLTNENTLDEGIECEGWYPEQVVRKALSKLPYLRGGVRVESLTEPILYFVRADGSDFKPEQHPSDMLSAVQAKAPYLYRDTYTGGAVASASLALGRGGVPSRTYDANDIRSSRGSAGFRTPPRSERRYSKVVVFRRNPDESYAFWAESIINYRGQKFQPSNRTFYVELQDPTESGVARAQTLSYELASRFTRGVYADELVLPSLDPLLERGDSFAVQGIFRERDASYQRSYMCWVKSIKNDIATLLPTIGYEAAIIFEDKLAVPTLLLAPVSSGVARLPYGIQGADIYFDDSLDWASIDGDDLVFSTDAPVSIDGDDLVIQE